MKRHFIRLAMLAVAALTMFLGSGAADAQNRSHHMVREANKRLTGNAYATLRGLDYDACEARCLAEAKCVALEHYRGGRVFNRQPQCKLFSSIGETRSNKHADIAFKRRGPGKASAKKKDVDRPAQSAAQDDTKRLEEATKRALSERQALQRRQPESAQRQAEVEAQRRRFDGARTSGSQAPEAVAPPPPVVVAPAPPAARSLVPPEAAPGAPETTTRRYYSRRSVVPEPMAPAPAAPSPSAEPVGGGAPARATRSIVPPPVGAAVPEAPPAAATAPSEWDIVPVFYGTDRKRRDLAKRIAYGSDRAHILQLGRALVTVPKSHQIPNVERPWVVKIPYLDITLYSETEDPRKHFTIKELSVLSREEMLRLVRERLGASSSFKDQALVFIHGYNNSFDDALFRTAQISYDLKFDGAAFLYSWPSGGGITSYPYDRESAQQSEQYLRNFLETVLKETGAKKVNIIAHSMGNQPLLQVLREFRRTNPDMARISQVILAAPDVDRDAFSYLADQIRGVAQGVTMYVSSNDFALGVSRRFAGGVPRAGDVPEGMGPVVVSGVDTIDISSLSTEYLALNHSTYAEQTALIKDIEILLRTGQRPPELRLPSLEKISISGGLYWRYPR